MHSNPQNMKPTPSTMYQVRQREKLLTLDQDSQERIVISHASATSSRGPYPVSPSPSSSIYFLQRRDTRLAARDPESTIASYF